MSSPAPVPAEHSWSALEAWVDPTASPPYLLMLLLDSSGRWLIIDPAQGYRTLFSTSSYEEAKAWVLEDEYEAVRGRMRSNVRDRLKRSPDLTTKEALSPFGQVVLTAYGYWHQPAAPDVPFPLDFWPKGTTVRRSDLQDDGWAVAVWDIEPARWPVEPWSTVLAGTLQALRDAGAVIAWFALEGGFADPPALFEPDQTGDA